MTWSRQYGAVQSGKYPRLNLVYINLFSLQNKQINTFSSGNLGIYSLPKLVSLLKPARFFKIKYPLPTRPPTPLDEEEEGDNSLCVYKVTLRGHVAKILPTFAVIAEF